MTEETTDLVLNYTQTHTVIKALDSYSRIWMGQFDHVAWDLRTEFDLFRFDDQGLDRAIEYLLGAIRALAIPELASANLFSSFGIWSQDAERMSNGRASSAYDMQQVIRHEEAWHNNPSGGSGTSYRRPWVRGPLPKLVCTCSGDSEESFLMTVHLLPKHRSLLEEVIEVRSLLLELRLRDMLSIFFDCPRALDLARALERLILGAVDPEVLSSACEETARLQRALSNSGT